MPDFSGTDSWPVPGRNCAWRLHALASAAVAATLAGCGGGGSAPPPNQPPVASFAASPEDGAPPLAVSFDASRSRDADGSIVRYEWDFGDGGTANGRSVRHTFEQAGAYTVRLTVVDDDNASGAASGEVLVNTDPLARIAADPVGGVAPLEVRFDASDSSDADGNIEGYAWDFGDGVLAAGAETAEQTFNEPGLYAVRLVVTDDLGGTGEVVFEVNVRDPVRSDIDHVVPYVEDGAHAADLAPCLYTYDPDSERCPLRRLHFLGAEFPDPTVDDVMSRVLVSHRWMGDNMRTLLQMVPRDALLLARSLTGIVIASDIRPAHYNAGTGAIYLDAEFLWRTAEQLAVVSQEPDYRAAFRRKLQVLLPWRFVRNNQRFQVRRDANGVRMTEDAAVFFGFLLFHELSHAADFMAFSRIDAADLSQTPWEAMVSAYLDWPSSQLRIQHPLRSALMLGLAQVSFTDTEATPEQAALQPEDIVAEFAADGAVDYYSYLTQFEDLADLHTAALLSYHFGQEQDTAITDNPAEEDAPLVVAWGQRGRITDERVIDRTRFVLEAMYPGDVSQMTAYLDSRPAPLPMRVGDTWSENVVLDGGADFSSRAPVGTLPGEDGWLASADGATSAGRHAFAGRYLGCIRIDERGSESLRELLDRTSGAPK